MVLINVGGTKLSWLFIVLACLICVGHGSLDHITLSGTQFFYSNGDQFFLKGTASLFYGIFTSATRTDIV